MELRHFRYFVAVADEGSFVRAAAKLRVAQPSLSTQIRNLEAELGVTLLHRLPRGVELTTAGHAFLREARNTLVSAARAAADAQRADEDGVRVLQFSTGVEMGIWAPPVANLLAAFRKAHPHIGIRLSNHDQVEQLAAVRERRVDVAATFLATWPPHGFEAHRLVDISMSGVLIAANHPLAAKPQLHLSELKGLMFLHLSGVHWPENFRILQSGLQERGLPPSHYRERGMTPSGSLVQIASGDAWSLANAEIGERFGAGSVAYRPFSDAPLPSWLSLIWMEGSSALVEDLINVAGAIGLKVEDDPPGRKLRATATGTAEMDLES